MATTSDIGYKNRWWIVAVMLAAEVMDLLDSTIVNVAGPSLKEQLGGTPENLQWVIGGYALTLGAGLILGGRLGDRYGRRTMFLVGLVSFTAASLLCAIAPSIESLILFRLIQGFAGAMLLPQGLGLIREAFPPSELGQAFGVFGPVYGLAGIFGPLVGGALIQANLLDSGWRSVFWVNIPIGIATIIIAMRIIPKKPGDKAIKIDLVGATIMALSSAALVLPIVQGQEAGWPLWTWLCLVGSAVGFGIFVLQQRASMRRGGTPLIDPGIFTKRAYSVGIGGIALFFAGLVGFSLVLTLFLQFGESFSAGEAGLATLPIAVGSAIGGALSGAVLADRFGRLVLQFGSLFQISGVIAIWVSLDQMGEFSIWPLVAGMALVGFGTGLVVAALFDIILASVDTKEIGSASGVLTAVQSIGAAVGVAIFGTVFFASAKVGEAIEGFKGALVVELVLVVLFLVLTPMLPKKAVESPTH